MTDEIATVQEGCAAGETTFTRVAPGDYVIGVDSRAQIPAVRGTSPVTVVAGEDAEVSVMLP